jgi:hypothetical protein
MVKKPASREEDDDGKIYTERELHRIVAKLRVDIYEGQDIDNPSVITRLALIETTISEIKKLKWYLVGAILAMIGGIIINFIRH